MLPKKINHRSLHRHYRLQHGEGELEKKGGWNCFDRWLGGLFTALSNDMMVHDDFVLECWQAGFRNESACLFYSATCRVSASLRWQSSLVAVPGGDQVLQLRKGKALGMATRIKSMAHMQRKKARCNSCLNERQS